MEFRIITPLFILSIFIGLFSACTKEVQIDIPAYEVKIVVDGRIEPGQPPIVLLSNNQDIYSPTNLEAFTNSFITGAVVEVSDGTNTFLLSEICTDNLPPGTGPFVAQILGIPESELANIHLCVYTSLDPNSFGEIGKTYQLKITHDGEEFTASTSILQPTPLNSIKWKQEDNDTLIGFAEANLSDPPNQFDGYFWQAQRINLNTDGEQTDDFFLTPWNPVFSDEFFDGLTFDFYFDNPGGYEDEVPDEQRGYYFYGDTVVVKFSKLDRDAFDFLERKHLQMGTSGNPFATPTNIPSNVSNGALGVWAGYSPSLDTFVCIP